jgi:hypothetical protein
MKFDRSQWRNWSARFPLELRAGGEHEWLLAHGRALGEHLKAYDWSQFVTLTNAKPVGNEGARRTFLGYHRRLTRVFQRPIPYFYAIEGDRGTGERHVHALLGRLHGVPLELIRRPWSSGQTHAAVYDANRHAAFYLTKAIAIDPDSYDLSATEPDKLP